MNAITNFQISHSGHPQTDETLIAKAREEIKKEAVKQTPVIRIEELCKNS